MLRAWKPSPLRINFRTTHLSTCNQDHCVALATTRSIQRKVLQDTVFCLCSHDGLFRDFPPSHSLLDLLQLHSVPTNQMKPFTQLPDLHVVFLNSTPVSTAPTFLKHSPSLGSWQVFTGFLPAERPLFLLSPLLAPSPLYNRWRPTFPQDSAPGPLLYQRSPLRVLLSSPMTFTGIYVPMAPRFLVHASR